MDVGIGLPATIPGVDGGQVIEWAKRAEARGFSSLGTIDRIVYGNYESLIALSAAAAVTERIRLATCILIAPYRNGAITAKQAASLDRLSGGRLTLGVAVGGREDDYEAAGVEFGTRGKRMDEMLGQWKRIWDGESFGYAGAIGPASKPRVVLGGTAPASYRRAARFDGWIAGGGGPDNFAEGAEQTRAAWREAGREDEPVLMALGYYALGTNAQDAANGYLRDYYGFLGDYADAIASSALVSEDAVRGAVDAFAAAGCGELVLFPCDPDPGQVDLLAEAIA
jgi:alkanesulfonate monooxygenase SsuD/methylene tetrahydromethanopterin reductase-like flavin-dependent oxidoreductase (luciferase family)